MSKAREIEGYMAAVEVVTKDSDRRATLEAEATKLRARLAEIEAELGA